MIFEEINSNLKFSLGYKLGWSLDQILSRPKGFSEDLITDQPSSYPGEVFNIAIYYLYGIYV